MSKRKRTQRGGAFEQNKKGKTNLLDFVFGHSGNHRTHSCVLFFLNGQVFQRISGWNAKSMWGDCPEYVHRNCSYFNATLFGTSHQHRNTQLESPRWIARVRILAKKHKLNPNFLLLILSIYSHVLIWYNSVLFCFGEARWWWVIKGGYLFLQFNKL